MKNTGNYTFDGEMSREVLNNYLSRAVTHFGIGYDNNVCSETFEDDLRMLKNEGAKFIGRATLLWASSVPDPEHFAFAAKRIARAHEVDPEFIMQGCVFECVYKPFVDKVEIPTYVFETFGLVPEKRCFSYDAMILTDEPENRWGTKQTGIPDITTVEAQMWCFYRAAEYIRAGCEAIHMGQVVLMGRKDPDFKCWKMVIDKIRAFGKVHARRHYVLIDAHTLGWLRQDETMFDYNAFPIRLKEVVDKPLHCICEEGYLDSMFNPKDGLCRPFIVEFDNFGNSPMAGQPTPEGPYETFAWGYDEITWFAHLPAEYRAEFLNYLHDWIKARYPEGWLQMPSRRIITGMGRYNYSANTKSPACPHGWSDEETVKSIFARS